MGVEFKTFEDFSPQSKNTGSSEAFTAILSVSTVVSPFPVNGTSFLTWAHW